MSLITVNLILGDDEGLLDTRLRSLTSTAQFASLTQTPILTQQGWCLCCQMHNETSEVLRGLFMQALHKQIPPFSQVFLRCATGIDPASIIYTLSQDFFLKERFRWAGALLLVSQPLVDELIHKAGGDYWDISQISTYIPLFANADVMLFTQDAFKQHDKSLFEQLMTQVYEHIGCFQPDIVPAPLLPLATLDKALLSTYQHQWQERKSISKKHSLFR
ncbi:hypothetical protein [Pelistega europaea]|uniref:Uncharacterized protein n=1 Tax=Pelistega europaea TaxID=106147 RepID=A0A7Y4L9B9_9BURK|nr:hypothetical protein [Pelistega europaea]NOL49360.1 hypothetical protein [Pelistega europaea]